MADAGMMKLDENFLASVGLAGLPEAQKKPMLDHIYQTLELRVGMKLAEQMTETQLDEFESYLPDPVTGQGGNDAAAFTWLETNFPGYKQVVADEMEKLRGEIAASAPQILAASTQPALGPEASNDKFSTAA